MKTLNSLPPGSTARIVRLHGSGPLFRRLLEMGLMESVEIRMIRSAPLGDPLEIELHGYRLSLRVAEAKMVEICK